MKSKANAQVLGESRLRETQKDKSPRVCRDTSRRRNHPRLRSKTVVPRGGWDDDESLSRGLSNPRRIVRRGDVKNNGCPGRGVHGDDCVPRGGREREREARRVSEIKSVTSRIEREEEGEEENRRPVDADRFEIRLFRGSLKQPPWKTLSRGLCISRGFPRHCNSLHNGGDGRRRIRRGRETGGEPLFSDLLDRDVRKGTGFIINVLLLQGRIGRIRETIDETS